MTAKRTPVEPETSTTQQAQDDEGAALRREWLLAEMESNSRSADVALAGAQAVREAERALDW